MIATRAQKRKEPTELHESEGDGRKMENTDRTKRKDTQKLIPEKTLDRPIEESIEIGMQTTIYHLEMYQN